MKKVVCRQCGLVNLDKFVSFPHCAACGVLLPTAKPSKWRQLWRRPVRPLYWMLAVGSGLGLLGLAIASIARETRAIGDQPLLVYAEIPREIGLGQTVRARLTLDSVKENTDEVFRRISLRLPRQTQSDFALISLKPKPDATQMRGRGLYYEWEELPRNVTLQLALQPRQAQKKTRRVLQLHATLWAARYQPYEVRASIAQTEKPPNAPIQKSPEVAR